MQKPLWNDVIYIFKTSVRHWYFLYIMHDHTFPPNRPYLPIIVIIIILFRMILSNGDINSPRLLRRMNL